MCKRKLANKKGFTLGETLVATLIMLMVSAIMVAGIPSAKNAYDKIVLKSNAEVAISTAISALRSEVSMSRNVIIDDEGKAITYISGSYNTVSRISIDSTGQLMYQRYYSGDSSSSGEPLVSSLASDGLVVKCTGVAKPEGKDYVTFEGLSVCKDNSDDSLVKPENLSILTL